MTESMVSVIVVSYNTKEKLRRCLGCIKTSHEIIVVDNASSDGSAEMVSLEFPHAKLVQNHENRGFGAANNQGLDLATREVVLFLNSDCYAEPGAIQVLAKAFEDSQVVAAGGELRNPDGTFQPSVARKLTLWAVFLEQTYLDRALRPFGLGYWVDRPYRERTDVDQVMGACLMMRKGERFDERYFLYCEDTDLCERLGKVGQIVLEPNAKFTHELGSSSMGPGRWRSVARYNRGKELYFEIHHGQFAAWICLILDRVGALLRLLLWSVASILTLGMMKSAPGRVGLFWKVLTSPVDGPDRAPHIHQ
ncbi:MAG TPA: glycosyltransferase family 2 protein [Fimbriimonadaceae bacterium]|nr:glycosyltransferase family 2 protein [Fimbriimonadaceae bacterium]